MENPYRVANFFGRRRDIKKVIGLLDRPTPSNVSIVGPMYIGKSAFIKTITEHFSRNDKNFNACIYWNVGRDLPRNDDEFFSVFARNAASPINAINASVGKYLQEKDVDFEMLNISFSTLEDEGKRVLYVMDGLDNLLVESALTRNLWENLRDLTRMSSLRFLTGSRKRLREIVGSPEARSSGFWNIFDDPPHYMEAFDEDDMNEVLAHFESRGIRFEMGARTEILNYSGGIPVLAISICKALWDQVSDGRSLNNRDVTEILGSFVDDRAELLEELWNDCGPDEHAIIVDLADGHQRIAGELPRSGFLRLRRRGFIHERGKEVNLCRTVEQYVKSYQKRTKEMQRLFGSRDDFDENIREVLSLRALQIENADEIMIQHAKWMIQKIDHPNNLLQEVRALVNRALELVFEKEAPDGNIPADWENYWFSRLNKSPTEKISEASKRWLLDLMTGKYKPPSSKVSKESYCHINNLYAVGNYGQHTGKPIQPGFAFTACFSAIELCDQLASDIAGN